VSAHTPNRGTETTRDARARARHPARSRLRDAWRRPERWARGLAASRRGLWSIGIASFLETIIVPIPIEIVLIPYMLARRDLLWTIALVTTLGCLLAATVGYGIGYFLYESVGRAAIGLMGWEDDFALFRLWFDAHGFWAVMAIGVVPIPFQVAMLAAGASSYPIPLFILAAGVARSLRYFGLALLVRPVGKRALALWKRHKTTAGIGLLLLVVALFGLSFLLPGG